MTRSFQLIGRLRAWLLRLKVMGSLLVLWQWVTVYICVAGVVGVARLPDSNALHLVLAGSQFLGLFLIVRLCYVLYRDHSSAPEYRSRVGALWVSGLLASAAMTLGAFALLSVKPSEVRAELDALYWLALVFAGPWAVALFFYVVAAMFSVMFHRSLYQRSAAHTRSGRP